MTLPNPLTYHVYAGQPLPRPNLYAYVMAGQGVLKYAENDFFSAAVPVADGAITGLPEFPEGVTLHLPRIPGKWLATVLRHARQAGEGNGVLTPIEQMYHFHWLDGWQVARPRQNAGGQRVDYHGGHEPTVVLDLHSHNEMPPFFSDKDDGDEQGLRFYAVIGRIYTTPQLRLRAGVYGDWLEVHPLLLFEDLGPFEAGNPGSRSELAWDYDENYHFQRRTK